MQTAMMSIEESLMRRSRRWTLLRTAACVMMVVVAGCVAQDVTVTPLLVRTKSVRLRIVADTFYRSAAAALGWTQGVPNLEVTLAQADSVETPIATLRTDSAGMVNIGALSAGTYLVIAKRLLTDAERQRVGGEIEGYIVHNPVRLGDVDSSSTLIFASRRGSLLVSEWAFQPGYYGQDDYVYGGFLELYNNADTTLYLDGALVETGVSQGIETQPESCAENARLVIDPAGIWGWMFDQFPGTGHTYPLVPGKMVVIATDAIDHRPLFKNALDLSHADFEYHGPNDVDNPAVPNLVDLGPFLDFGGHGSLSRPDNVVAIARPLDIDTLRRQRSPTDTDFRLVPKSALLDALAFRTISDYGHTPCDVLVSPAIVHDDTRLLDAPPDPFVTSVNRRILYTRPDGRRVLQNTRSSRADLQLGPRTPGWIP